MTEPVQTHPTNALARFVKAGLRGYWRIGARRITRLWKERQPDEVSYS